jgi:hypothetical protein
MEKKRGGGRESPPPLPEKQRLIWQYQYIFPAVLYDEK